jgi:hypothetical protein
LDIFWLKAKDLPGKLPGSLGMPKLKGPVGFR